MLPSETGKKDRSLEMKDNSKRRKHKHHQTYSNSSSDVSDDEKYYKKKSSKYSNIHDIEPEDTKQHQHHHHHHHHRKHSRKHKRSQSIDSDSCTEVSKDKKSKHHDDFTAVKIKQEPVSDNDDYNSRKTKREDRDDSDIRSLGDRQRTGDRENSNRRDLADGRNRHINHEPESGGEEPQWGRRDSKTEGGQRKPQVNKAKPDFGLSGKLAEDTNTFNGVVIKYSEPPEARKPKRRWRLYPFKGDVGLSTLYIHRQSAYLIGRDRKVADIPVDHPSCSKQHAALQYRLVPYTKADGTTGKRVRPYIIDLESANGTYVNNIKIEPKKYVELLEKDVIKFAYSSREYVILHEHSRDSDQDDDDV